MIIIIINNNDDDDDDYDNDDDDDDDVIGLHNYCSWVKLDYLLIDYYDY